MSRRCSGRTGRAETDEKQRRGAGRGSARAAQQSDGPVLAFDVQTNLFDIGLRVRGR